MERKRKRRRHQEKKQAGRHGRVFNNLLENRNFEKKFKRQDEDILKFIYEGDGNAISSSKLMDFLRKVNGNPKKILKRLLNTELILSKNHSYFLTYVGKEIAKEIFKKHIEIEEFIKGRTKSCNAHEMAHILEHNLTKEAIRRIIKISKLKDKGICLNNFKFQSGMIVDVTLEDCAIWTKLISLGIFPGQRIRVLSRGPTNYLIEVKHSKLAIDRILAEGILLIP